MLVAAAAACAAAFPNSDDPVAVSAGALQLPDRAPCVVPLLRDVDARTPVSSNYSTAPCGEACTWSRVVVRVTGRVRGTQYDRFGGLWVKGIELMRVVTPEPTPAGIRWGAERDVTEYARALEGAGAATLAIANYGDASFVNNASLLIYRGAPPLPPFVYPLLPPPPAPAAAWRAVPPDAGMALATPSLPPATERLSLDVMLSGHGCGEFEAGYDCGPAVRRVVVSVDDHPAGAAYPYPVIYSGGANPVLWRPVAGLRSLSVPPLRFDLSPFVGLLQRGGAHTLRIRVTNTTADRDQWYATPTLVAWEAPGEERLTGELLSAVGGGAGSARNATGGSVLYSDTAHWAAVGVLRGAAGGDRRVSVAGSLSAAHNYTTRGEGGPTQPPPQRWAAGWLVSNVTSSGGAGPGVSRWRRHEYDVWEHETDGASSFRLQATAAVRTAAVDAVGAAAARWAESVVSSALYNRSTANRSLVFAESNAAEGLFTVATAAAGAECYRRQLRAANGSVSAPPPASRCAAAAWPEGWCFLGDEGLQPVYC